MQFDTRISSHSNFYASLYVAYLWFEFCITGLQILPNVTEEIIEKGSSLTLVCSDDGPLQWFYPTNDVSYSVYRVPYSVFIYS